MKKIVCGLFIVAVVTLLVIMPGLIEKRMNVVLEHPPYQVSEQAAALHKTLLVGDWHADSLLWNRNLGQQSKRGHVDIPRLQQGNVALQMFTTVTKSPSGQNYDSNDSNASDNITTLALAQRWPVKTYDNLTERAVYQANKMAKLGKRYSESFRFIRSQSQLQNFLEERKKQTNLVGGLLGTEGSHALSGKLENIDLLFNKGFRMMSLQHFFDNKLGGSLHGTSGAGLSEFGRQAVKKMQSLDIIVDVAHSSEQTVRDVLAISVKPLIVSHTGFNGHCDSPRNISDELMKNIAAAGGLIAVGYWDGAVCSPQVKAIAESIQYGIALVGADHVALGSDFDGTVTTTLDTSELAILTQTLLESGVSEMDIRKVMGGNMLAFLQSQLPVN